MAWRCWCTCLPGRVPTTIEEDVLGDQEMLTLFNLVFSISKSNFYSVPLVHRTHLHGAVIYQ